MLPSSHHFSSLLTLSFHPSSPYLFQSVPCFLHLSDPPPHAHTVPGCSGAISLPPVMGYKYLVKQRRRLKADNEQQEAILKKGQGEITVATVSAGACTVLTQI